MPTRGASLIRITTGRTTTSGSTMVNKQGESEDVEGDRLDGR